MKVNLLSSQVKSTNNSHEDILFLLLNYLSVFQYFIIGFLHFPTSDRYPSGQKEIQWKYYIYECDNTIGCLHKIIAMSFIETK